MTCYRIRASPLGPGFVQVARSSIALDLRVNEKLYSIRAISRQASLNLGYSARMPNDRFDPITVVEKAYALDEGPEAWFDAISLAVAPGLPPHDLLLWTTYEAHGTRLTYPHASLVRAQGDPAALDVQSFVSPMAKVMEGTEGPPELDLSGVDFWARGSWSYASMVETLGDGHPFLEASNRKMRPLGLSDCVNLMCRTDANHGFVVAAFLKHPVSVGKAQQRRFGRIASHLASAHRLREAIGEGTHLEATSREAVFTPDGQTVDATSEAMKASGLREVARARIRAIDRARSGLRSADEGDEALDLWKGLVDGTWSLVDAYDTDGRRYVVAHRNPPGVRDPRGLTPREQQVAHFVTFGQSNAEIAYALGLSESAVGTHVGQLLRKFNCNRRSDLINTIKALQRRGARSVTDDLATASLPQIDVSDPRFDALTPAEREVLPLLVGGLSHAHIAERRSVGLPTINKQVTSIYRKLGVRDRATLLSSISCREGAHGKRPYRPEHRKQQARAHDEK